MKLAFPSRLASSVTGPERERHAPRGAERGSELNFPVVPFRPYRPWGGLLPLSAPDACDALAQGSSRLAIGIVNASSPCVEPIDDDGPAARPTEPARRDLAIAPNTPPDEPATLQPLPLSVIGRHDPDGVVGDVTDEQLRRLIGRLFVPFNDNNPQQRFAMSFAGTAYRTLIHVNFRNAVAERCRAHPTESRAVAQSRIAQRLVALCIENVLAGAAIQSQFPESLPPVLRAGNAQTDREFADWFACSLYRGMIGDRFASGPEISNMVQLLGLALNIHMLSQSILTGEDCGGLS